MPAPLSQFKYLGLGGGLAETWATTFDTHVLSDIGSIVAAMPTNTSSAFAQLQTDIKTANQFKSTAERDFSEVARTLHIRNSKGIGLPTWGTGS